MPANETPSKRRDGSGPPTSMKPELALLIDADQGSPALLQQELENLEAAWTVSARLCIRNWRSTSEIKAWTQVARDCSLECIQNSPEVPGRNSTDIELAVRAMDLFHSGYRNFCILSGDSDFRPLQRRLQRAGGVVILKPLVVRADPAPQPPPGPPPGTGSRDTEGYRSVFAEAYERAAAERLLGAGVPLMVIGQAIPADRKHPAFGYPKSWPLRKVIETLPGFAVESDANGSYLVRRT